MSTGKKDRVFKALKPADPKEPAPFDETIANAIQKMIDGTASGHLQKIGMAWIINQASNAHGVHLYDTDRDTAIALGRAFVGQQILGIAKIQLINFAAPPQPTPTPQSQPKPRPTRKKKETTNA